MPWIVPIFIHEYLSNNFFPFRESQKGEYHEQEVEEITKPLLPSDQLTAADILDQQIIDSEENPENNEIKNELFKKKRSSNMYSM